MLKISGNNSNWIFLPVQMIQQNINDHSDVITFHLHWTVGNYFVWHNRKTVCSFWNILMYGIVVEIRIRPFQNFRVHSMLNVDSENWASGFAQVQFLNTAKQRFPVVLFICDLKFGSCLCKIYSVGGKSNTNAFYCRDDEIRKQVKASLFFFSY